MLGADPSKIDDVIITHLHYDHAGDLESFPNARFFLQDREMAYATGRCMCHAPLRHAYAVDYVVNMVRLVYDDRVQYVDGEMQIAPGLSVHHIGGHTDGVQSVRSLDPQGLARARIRRQPFLRQYGDPEPFPHRLQRRRHA